MYFFYSFLLIMFLAGCSRNDVPGNNPDSKPLRTSSFKYARNFAVEDYGTFKKVTVKNPWRNSKDHFVTILKKRSTVLDTSFGDVPVIETPVEKIITLSTVYLPLIDSLGGIEKIKAVADANHVNNPVLRKKLDGGEIPQVKSGGSINYETILEINPDVVFSFAVGDPKFDTHNQMSSRKIPMVIMSSYMEDSPLGRAEWIKFVALFLEKDSLAERIYNRVDSAYGQLIKLTDTLARKPVVFSGSVFGGVWHVPGGKSFTARLFADAGGDYLWKNNPKRGGVPLSFEAVYEKASQAEFWLNPSNWVALNDGIKQDKRYALFSAFNSGGLFNNNARLNKFGGNDYFETGSANPHLVLKDLIKIFHPEVFPNDSLYFYRKLK